MRQILPALDTKAILADLNPKDISSYYTLDCPECKHPKVFIYKNEGVIICKRRNNCGSTTSFISYF